MDEKLYQIRLVRAKEADMTVKARSVSQLRAFLSRMSDPDDEFAFTDRSAIAINWLLDQADSSFVYLIDSINLLSGGPVVLSGSIVDLTDFEAADTDAPDLSGEASNH